MNTRPALWLLIPLLFCPSFAGGPRRVAANQSEPARGESTAVAFCEMVENPRRYFDRLVRVEATYRVGFETAYLIDEGCGPNRRGRVGVGFVNAEGGDIRQDVDRIMSGEYGNGRAGVVVAGMLRDAPDRGFGGYRYRFDIVRFEDMRRADVSRAVVTYEGALQAGLTYRATVRGDVDFGLSLVPAPRVLLHHAMRVEWTNLREFGALRRLRRGGGERRIVFGVLSDEIRHAGERRWNRTVRCEVIAVE